MIPIIAIVGQPNVGKSTLFNCLTNTRRALVADKAGVTRDRIYGEGQKNERRYIVIDTGGLEGEQSEIANLAAIQTMLAVEQADIVLFVVDAHKGLTAIDREIAARLRKLSKKICVVINKIDSTNTDTVLGDFYELGVSELFPISAIHRRGINSLVDHVLSSLSMVNAPAESDLDKGGIKIVFIGRPNVGKSTLVNRILGEERVIVYDQPGTTRDSIFIPFRRSNIDYVLIDTAGVRKKSKIDEAVEKFSTIKALQAIEESNVMVLVVNAYEGGITDQDLHLLDFAVEAGKALVIAINKWDSIEQYQRDQVQKELDRRLAFIDFARVHFISARYGTGINELFKSINEAYRSANKKLSASQLTKVLEQAVEAHQPPLIHGRRIKLRFAHPAGNNPPFIVIHGNQVKSLPDSYRTYLAKTFRKKFKLIGTPIKIEFKNSTNPYVSV